MIVFADKVAARPENGLCRQSGFDGVIGLAGVETGFQDGFLEWCAWMRLEVGFHVLQAQTVHVVEKASQPGPEEAGEGRPPSLPSGHRRPHHDGCRGSVALQEQNQTEMTKSIKDIPWECGKGWRWRFLPSEWSPDSDTGPFSRLETQNGPSFWMAVSLEMLIFAVR